MAWVYYVRVLLLQQILAITKRENASHTMGLRKQKSLFPFLFSFLLEYLFGQLHLIYTYIYIYIYIYIDVIQLQNRPNKYIYRCDTTTK
jgi:hypothetical protein